MNNITYSSATTSSARSPTPPLSQKRPRESDDVDDRVASAAEIVTDKKPKFDPAAYAEETITKIKELIKNGLPNSADKFFLASETENPGLLRPYAVRLLETTVRNYNHSSRFFLESLRKHYFPNGITLSQLHRLYQIVPLITAQNPAKDAYIREAISNMIPTPFVWSQTMMKLIERGDERMIHHFWNLAKKPPIALKLPVNWSTLMIDHYRSPSENNKAFIRLLPMLFEYNNATDALFAEDAEDIQYIDYNNSENWLNAIGVALVEKPGALNMLLASRIIKQLDLSVRIEAFKLLAQHKAFYHAEELFTNHTGFRELSLEQINELYLFIAPIPGCGPLLGRLISERNYKENISEV